MAGAAGMAVGGSAASVSSRAFSPARVTSQSSEHFFSRGEDSKLVLIAPCLASAVPSCPPRRSHQPPLLPSSLYALPTSRSSFVGSGTFKNFGLVVGWNARFVHDLRWATLTHSRSKGRSMAGESERVLEDSIQKKNSSNPVVIYSRSWCPYCGMVKALFTKLRVFFEVVELDQLADDQEVQEALRKLTGQGTVPNIFIGGKHIGGCDDTMSLHKRGQLVPLLEAAGAQFTAA